MSSDDTYDLSVEDYEDYFAHMKAALGLDPSDPLPDVLTEEQMEMLYNYMDRNVTDVADITPSEGHWELTEVRMVDDDDDDDE